jgi:hypothetical protein
MKRQALSRREMLIGGAMSPLWLANAQAPPERGQLSSNWPFEKLGPALLPREQWRPFPPAADRAAWEKLPATEREEWIRAAEAHLGAAWPPLPATVFLEFQRTGNRTGYQRIRDQRRHRLEELVLGECAEGKGRFMDEIVNGVWATCEETFWGVPAHLGAQRAGVGLPDVSEPVVDLFAAETASLLAWTDYLLGPRLEEVSPLLRPRIHAEIDRRILTPCLHREAFGWMGFHSDRPVNNWNPWINSNWLTATLLLEPNPRRRTASVHKILRSVDRFLDGYHEDGGCDEGPSYWTRAGGSLFDCLELLYSASEGRIDFYRLPLIGEIGRYVWRAHIFEDWFVNFADAPARVRLPGDLVFRYGRRIGDAPLQMLGAWAGRSGGGREGSIGRTLHAIFNRETLRQAPAGQPLARDAWMPGIQVMTARVREGSAEGLYLAAQGGHNAESHNHNDVGNFIVYANGQPALIDVGVETYTAKTFGPNRYDIWTMQSAYHNLPTIGGVMQAPGRHAEARNVWYRADTEAAEFRLDIAGAYPPEAGLRSWLRTLRLDRKRNEILLREQFTLERTPKEITLTFMTPCPPRIETGRVLLSGGFPKDTRVTLSFPAQTFQASAEEIPLEDEALRRSWGAKLYRVLLRAARPPLQGEWTLRLVQS